MPEESKEADLLQREGIRVHGLVREAVVVSAKERKSAVVQIDYTRKVSKYERLEKRKSRLHVHVPEGMNVKEGDHVLVGECRKLSKTKSHVIIKKI